MLPYVLRPTQSSNISDKVIRVVPKIDYVITPNLEVLVYHIV